MVGLVYRAVRCRMGCCLTLSSAHIRQHSVIHQADTCSSTDATTQTSTITIASTTIIATVVIITSIPTINSITRLPILQCTGLQEEELVCVGAPRKQPFRSVCLA